MGDDDLAGLLARLAADRDGDGAAIAAHASATGIDAILGSLDDPELDGPEVGDFDPAWNRDGA
jgi:hypothetical protein